LEVLKFLIISLVGAFITQLAELRHVLLLEGGCVEVIVSLFILYKVKRLISDTYLVR